MTKRATKRMVDADDPTSGHKEPEASEDSQQESADVRAFPESEANVLGVARNEGGEDALTKRIAESGLFYIKNHILEDEYVGISPQTDPDASPSTKAKTSVMPLTILAPRTGMQVRLKDGTSFVIGDGFGTDSSPEDWGAVTRPDGSLLFG